MFTWSLIQEWSGRVFWYATWRHCANSLCVWWLFPRHDDINWSRRNKSKRTSLTVSWFDIVLALEANSIVRRDSLACFTDGDMAEGENRSVWERKKERERERLTWNEIDHLGEEKEKEKEEVQRKRGRNGLRESRGMSGVGRKGRKEGGGGGDSPAIMVVLELPPRLSFKRRVSCVFRNPAIFVFFFRRADAKAERQTKKVGHGDTKNDQNFCVSACREKDYNSIFFSFFLKKNFFTLPAKLSMTCRRKVSDLLMLIPAFRAEPLVPALSHRSLPARSTRWSLLLCPSFCSLQE